MRTKRVMAMKDYYVVLGVPRNENTTGIRKAYREGAKRLHPDRTGGSGTRAFQELAEAYDVLSDPARRREHDRQLDEAEGRARFRVRTRAPRAPRTRPPAAAPFVEPLVPEPHEVGRGEDRFGIPWRGSPSRLELLMTLSPTEAARGGVVPVGIPMTGPCRSCRGRLLARLLCLDCGGSGVTRGVETVAVRFPPGVRSGTSIDVPLRAGDVEMELRLRLFIA